MKIFDRFRRSSPAAQPQPGGAGEKVTAAHSTKRDLFDLAKPARDIALVHHEQQAAALKIHPAAEAANRLGLHLTAVLLAFVADRHKTLEGNLSDEHLQNIISAGIAMALGNACVNWRPIIDGVIMPPSINAHIQLQRVAGETFRQVASAEHGVQDFNIQYQVNADGSLSEKAFDYTKMMKGQG